MKTSKDWFLFIVGLLIGFLVLNTITNKHPKTFLQEEGFHNVKIKNLPFSMDCSRKEAAYAFEAQQGSQIKSGILCCLASSCRILN